ncbi:hypothetical protein [Peromfec virus RodF5_9]|uniref:Lipoprotein n=1 Tax=Peromfec virus RodF5_9 TaxID=2929345 RepID=A0A976R8V8_9VIRU|nr:hypothetical protein [Peromfec virus RodF5_9]
MKTFFLKLLTSKKFWTLISALVAALASFFLSSCSATVRYTSSGLHHDTVTRVFITRTNNFSNNNQNF